MNATASNVTEVPVDTSTYHFAGSPQLMKFHLWYIGVHGYIATVVCALGIIANVLNIVVLTRKNMISATNCILTGLAVSDGLTMVVYLPFALRFYCLYGTDPSVERNTLSATRFMLFFACFSVVVHTISIWLTVTLAVFRYIFIKYPRHGAVVCSLPRAKLAVFLTYVVTLVACIPNFAIIDIVGNKKVIGNTTHTIWEVAFRENKPLQSFNFWVQAILVKLVPCTGLTLLSYLLIRTMQKAEKRRRNLKMQTLKSDEESSRDRKTNRTTRMLLTVVILFLLTEFPQGIITLLSGTLPHFTEEIYHPLGDTIDILALLNNGINFILYCTMSKQFRDTFIELFLKHVHSSIDNNHTRFTAVPTSTVLK